MKVFVVFFETGKYDDYSYTLQGIFATRHLAELYIENEKNKNMALSSLTNKYKEALSKWQDENNHRFEWTSEPQLHETIRSMRGELCDDCDKLRNIVEKDGKKYVGERTLNDICQNCLSKEDKKKAVDRHSKNKSIWAQQEQKICKEFGLAEREFTNMFLKSHEDELRKFEITDPTWYPNIYLYHEDDKFEIEEHEVKEHA